MFYLVVILLTISIFYFYWAVWFWTSLEIRSYGFWTDFSPFLAQTRLNLSYSSHMLVSAHRPIRNTYHLEKLITTSTGILPRTFRLFFWIFEISFHIKIHLIIPSLLFTYDNSQQFKKGTSLRFCFQSEE